MVFLKEFMLRFVGGAELVMPEDIKSAGSGVWHAVISHTHARQAVPIMPVMRFMLPLLVIDD